jgi:hypothetical protein
VFTDTLGVIAVAWLDPITPGRLAHTTLRRHRGVCIPTGIGCVADSCCCCSRAFADGVAADC